MHDSRNLQFWFQHQETNSSQLINPNQNLHAKNGFSERKRKRPEKYSDTPCMA